MVNGGGTVLLELSRAGLKPKVVAVTAVCNQFVNIDTVSMSLLEDSQSAETNQVPCDWQMHNSTNAQRPIVKTSWKEIRTYYYDNSLVLPDSGVVRNELSIAETNYKLVYTSTQAAGFSSTIFMLLTKSQIPDTLKHVHLKISVEGVLHKQTLDAYASLSYEFAWDRRNAYEQRVYGVAFARVMIGYEYEDCSFVYWQHFAVKLAGYDLSSSEIGSWNLDVHHRLNPQQGILHKGDGTTIYLNEIQKQVEIVAGQLRLKRGFDCVPNQCDNELNERQSIKFYSPSSLSINKDGIIFVADYNYVWMLNNTGMPQRALELK
jgi:hypothetical protein